MVKAGEVGYVLPDLKTCQFSSSFGRLYESKKASVLVSESPDVLLSSASSCWVVNSRLKLPEIFSRAKIDYSASD